MFQFSFFQILVPLGCSRIQSSWEELLTIDTNQNSRWLKFLILRCFTIWSFSPKSQIWSILEQEPLISKHFIYDSASSFKDFLERNFCIHGKNFSIARISRFSSAHTVMLWSADLPHVLYILGGDNRILCLWKEIWLGLSKGLLQFPSKHSLIFLKYGCFFKCNLFGLTPDER